MVKICQLWQKGDGSSPKFCSNGMGRDALGYLYIKLLVDAYVVMLDMGCGPLAE